MFAQPAQEGTTYAAGEGARSGVWRRLCLLLSAIQAPSASASPVQEPAVITWVMTSQPEVLLGFSTLGAVIVISFDPGQNNWNVLVCGPDVASIAFTLAPAATDAHPVPTCCCVENRWKVVVPTFAILKSRFPG